MLFNLFSLFLSLQSLVMLHVCASARLVVAVLVRVERNDFVLIIILVVVHGVFVGFRLI